MSRRDPEWPHQLQRHRHGQSMPQPYVQPQQQLPPPVTPQHQQYPKQQRTSQRHHATGTSTRQGKKPKFHDKKYHKLPLPERPSRRSSVYGPLSEFGGYAASADTVDTAESDAHLVNDSGYATDSGRSEMTIRPAEPDDGGRYLLEAALRPSDSCSNWGGPEAPAARAIEPGIPLRPAPIRTGTLAQQRQILYADPSHTYHQQAGRAPSYASSSISAPSAVPTTEYQGDDDRSEFSSTFIQSQADSDGLNDDINSFFESSPLGAVVQMIEFQFQTMRGYVPKKHRKDFHGTKIGLKRLKDYFFGGDLPIEESSSSEEYFSNEE